MTRPKVPDDKRQRTAQACDTCKRRKQKCDGLQPCGTCKKRQCMCTYDTPNAHASGSHAKRRQRDKSTVHDSAPAFEESGGTSVASPMALTSPPQHALGHSFDWERFYADFENYSIYNHDVGQDEEVPVSPISIFLEEPENGTRPPRLWFIGTAANSAFLAMMRIAVEEIAGKDTASPFSNDPDRHRITENTPHFSEPVSYPGITSDSQKIDAQAMPYFPQDRQMADILVESYFTNTFGLVEIFARRQFLDSIDECYGNPYSVDRSFLCHFYLVLALGLVLAAPVSGSREEQIIGELLAKCPGRAEEFFLSAKVSRDPAAVVLEGANIWSIQGLCLMSIYMMVVWRRNAAYLHLGIAVRSAYALGLHSGPQNHGGVLFEKEDIKVQQNLWKSLFILECFCSTTLGRPMAISDDESWIDLKMPDVGLDFPGSPRILESDEAHTHAVDGAVRCCHIIGVVTRKLYRSGGDKISTATARKVADKYMSTANWKEKLYQSYELWRQASRAGRPNATACGNAVLHVHLFHLHATILFTRPFFLWRVRAAGRISKQAVGGGLDGLAPSHRGSRLDSFAEDCVRASFHTIHLIQTVRETQGLPQNNPFVLYFLHAACLVVLSNQCASLYDLDDFASAMATAKGFVSECGVHNPEASRTLSVLESFHRVVDNWKGQPTNSKGKGVARPHEAGVAMATNSLAGALASPVGQENYTSFQDHTAGKREPDLMDQQQQQQQQSTAWSGTGSGQSSNRTPVALSIHPDYAFPPSQTHPAAHPRMAWTPQNDAFSPLSHSPAKMSQSRSTDVSPIGGAPGRNTSVDYGSGSDVLADLNMSDGWLGTWPQHDGGGSGGVGGGGGGGSSGGDMQGSLDISAGMASLTTQVHHQQQQSGSSFQPPPPPQTSSPAHGPSGPRFGSFGTPSPTTPGATSNMTAGPGLLPSTMDRMPRDNAGSRRGESRGGQASIRRTTATSRTLPEGQSRPNG